MANPMSVTSSPMPVVKQPVVNISKATLSPTSSAPVKEQPKSMPVPLSVTSSAMPVNNVTTSPTSSAPIPKPTEKKQQGGYIVDQSVMFMYGGCVNLQSDMYGGSNKDKEIEKVFYLENSLEQPKKPTQKGGAMRRKNSTDDKMNKIFYQSNSVEEKKNQKVEEPEKKQNGILRRRTIEESKKNKQSGGYMQTNLVSLIPSNLRDLSEENYNNYNNELLRLKAIYYGNEYKN